MATLAFAVDTRGSIAANPKMRGLKMVFGKFTLDTSYPDGGYTAATLEALAGLSPYVTTIKAVVPFGGAVAADKVIPAAWDGTNRTLMFGTDTGVELTTGDNALDGTILACLIYGY